MNKLYDMALRVKEAYEDNAVSRVHALGMGSLAIGKYWVIYKPTHDVDSKSVPRYGRAVVLTLNQHGKLCESHPFRGIFVYDVAQLFAGDTTFGKSVLYEPGEEEEIADNVFQFLVQTKSLDEITLAITE
jgi:hypothetical protein